MYISILSEFHHRYIIWTFHNSRFKCMTRGHKLWPIRKLMWNEPISTVVHWNHVGLVVGCVAVDIFWCVTMQVNIIEIVKWSSFQFGRVEMRRKPGHCVLQLVLDSSLRESCITFNHNFETLNFQHAIYMHGQHKTK